MTPLAQRIVRELTLRIKDRTFNDKAGVIPLMTDVHCFELTAVLPLIEALAEHYWDNGRDGEFVTGRAVDRQLAFLPAPRTWIEWRLPEVGRVGAHLRSGTLYPNVGEDGSFFFKEGAENDVASVRVCNINATQKGFTMTLGGASEVGKTLGAPIDSMDVKQSRGMSFYYLAALALINTPRIIGRKTHMPHRGLERALLQNKTMIGRFPLHAWTEITLECSPPKHMEGEPGYEAHLTGARCLHFCRAHLRIKGGRVEFVRSHWRGDPALGIKQSRYLVTP